jgi:hypothetical protein
VRRLRPGQARFAAEKSGVWAADLPKFRTSAFSGSPLPTLRQGRALDGDRVNEKWGGSLAKRHVASQKHWNKTLSRTCKFIERKWRIGGNTRLQLKPKWTAQMAIFPVPEVRESWIFVETVDPTTASSQSVVGGIERTWIRSANPCHSTDTRRRY